jgi:hypothetical protein
MTPCRKSPSQWIDDTGGRSLILITSQRKAMYNAERRVWRDILLDACGRPAFSPDWSGVGLT